MISLFSNSVLTNKVNVKREKMREKRRNKIGEHESTHHSLLAAESRPRVEFDSGHWATNIMNKFKRGYTWFMCRLVKWIKYTVLVGLVNELLHPTNIPLVENVRLTLPSGSMVFKCTNQNLDLFVSFTIMWNYVDTCPIQSKGFVLWSFHSWYVLISASTGEGGDCLEELNLEVSNPIIMRCSVGG